MWPDVRAAFATVWRLAAVLTNEDGSSGPVVRRRYRARLAALTRDRASYGQLAGALDHFGKVTQSYGRGLFQCYEVDGLPRTNNQLEQFFGSYRYHERRCSGRKVACPGTVVRGSVRLIAAAATRSRPIGVPALIPSDVAAWRQLRRSLQRRQAVRAHGRRFRRDPVAYLRSLEDALINQVLPP
jgi:hypothetical protein